MGAAWSDMLIDAIEVKAAKTRASSRAASNNNRVTRVGFSVPAYVYLMRAARQRGISLSGYIRRATLAVAAMDLGLEPVDLFAEDAAITPLGKRGTLPTKDLDGALYGRWEVRPR